jgi:IclR family transcriptional regulator, acetate operon repressor
MDRASVVTPIAKSLRRLEPEDITPRMTTVEAVPRELATRRALSMPRDRSSDKSLIQSVERALDILESLADAPRSMKLQEIGARCDLNHSTCHHLLNTLVHRGYVTRSNAGRGYSLGSRLPELIGKRCGTFDLIDEALPLMRRLCVDLKETIVLASLSGSNLRLLLQLDANGLPADDVDQSLFMQASHAAAVGKAMLAWLPEAQIARVVADQGLIRFTEKTIGSLGELAESLRQARRHGFALDDEEFLTGTLGFGCAVRGPSGEVVGAIGCVLPRTDVTQTRMIDAQHRLVQAATVLSRRLSLAQRSTA